MTPDDVEEQIVQSVSQSVEYMHCSTIDALFVMLVRPSAKLSAGRWGWDQWEDRYSENEEHYMDAIEDTREEFQANPF